MFFKDADKTPPELNAVLQRAEEVGASDIMLRRGLPIFYKVAGSWYHFSDAPLATVEDYIGGIGELMGWKELLHRLHQRKEMDFSFSVPHGTRYRVNMALTSDGPLIVLRLIRQDIRFLEDLGFLPASVEAIVKALKAKRGLVLVTGVTGSGKSTTLAAMIHWLNRHTASNIVTIEDPIEYIFIPEKSAIHQRELGAHTESFSQALKSALRQAPDVIMVGEMRDPETIKAALTAAETGHLVISTLHTKSAPETVTRIVDALPPEDKPQARQQLASSLAIVISQKLVPAVGKGKMVLAYEMFVKNDAIRQAIASGESTFDNTVREAMRVGGAQGMVLLEQSLANYVKEGAVLPEVALSYANRPEEMETQLRRLGIDPQGLALSGTPVPKRPLGSGEREEGEGKSGEVLLGRRSSCSVVSEGEGAQALATREEGGLVGGGRKRSLGELAPPVV